MDFGQGREEDRGSGGEGISVTLIVAALSTWHVEGDLLQQTASSFH